MTSYQKLKLFETRRRIFKQVSFGSMTVSKGAELLGLSRQAFWYRRKQLEKYGTNMLLYLAKEAQSHLTGLTIEPKKNTKIWWKPSETPSISAPIESGLC